MPPTSTYFLSDDINITGSPLLVFTVSHTTKKKDPNTTTAKATRGRITRDDELLQSAAAAGRSSPAARLSAGGISEGRLSSTGISTTAGISTARLSSAARISSAVCASVRSASSAAANFNGNWMFARMVSSLSLSVFVGFECGESNRVDLLTAS